MKRYVKALAVTFSAASLIGITAAYAAGLWSTLPHVGQGSFCASTVSGVTLPAAQGPYGVVPGSTQGTGQGPCAQTVPAGPALTGNENVPADLNGGGDPQSGTIASSILAGATFETPRNFLGNGALNITQMNGTSTVTCATTSAPTTAAISADRWICDANVGSGAGRSAIITSSPTPPTGFSNAMKVWRNSGALTQPVCTWSAVPTVEATQLAGQTVTFSAYVAALAGLAADNGGVANLVIITGTGTDEALNGSWTASPAITPAWTGIATAVNTPITLSTSFARFSTTATLPATATEVGVGLCFTPTASGAGATDGFAWTGGQLERAPGASLFEVHPKAADQNDALAYFWKVTEGAASTIRGMCTSSTTSLEMCNITFPRAMYKTPTMGYTAGFASCTTTACSALQACTAVRTSTTITGMAATQYAVPVDCTSTAGFPAAGSATVLADNGGSGVITAWTGF